MASGRALNSLTSSNIVKIRRTFENPTSASFKFNNCLWISPEVGGVFHENDVIFPRAGKTFHFKRAKGFAVSSVEPEQGWAVVINKKKKQSLGIIAGDTDKSDILSLDIGETILELFIISRVLLLPRETCELQDFVLLADDKYEAIGDMAALLRTQGAPAHG